MGHSSSDDAAMDVGVQQYCHGSAAEAMVMMVLPWTLRGGDGAAMAVVAVVVLL